MHWGRERERGRREEEEEGGREGERREGGREREGGEGGEGGREREGERGREGGRERGRRERRREGERREGGMSTIERRVRFSCMCSCNRNFLFHHTYLLPSLLEQSLQMLSSLTTK